MHAHQQSDALSPFLPQRFIIAHRHRVSTLWEWIHRYVSPPELVELIRTLAEEFSDAQIARILYRKRLKTPKGKSFKAYHVANVRKQHGIRPGPVVPVQGDDVYTAEEAGELLAVARCTVIRWIEVGLLKGRQVTPGAPWRILVAKEDIERLKPTDVG